jgi:uncharacterized protein YcfJ
MESTMQNNLLMGLALGIGIAATVGAGAYVMSNRAPSSADAARPAATKVAAEADCWNETVTTTRKGEDHQVAGTVVGGALGGLAGNQFGKGSGNAAATAAGAVAGALIGKNQGKPETYQESHVVRRCR